MLTPNRNINNMHYYLKNTGPIGLARFRTEHVCGTICQALGFAQLVPDATLTFDVALTFDDL
jgi:hypothetical protein